MDTILETGQNVERISSARNGEDEPREEWIRGICPTCGEPLVSNLYYVGGRGYLCVWECWGSLADAPTCGYQRVL